ncbi:DnaT-like ssDNA-binding protein [Sphingomonas sp. Leaf412]|uniref:DnaT-like ssDNA-binding protein n=1 Tax=Sphingomonas sp. Leaf412 TaxID=1736370 RepID=UPI000ADAF738|nr:DnaT-like ssDNA-binding protein [Sphingomonas sp. Leaf412]
MTYDDLNDEEPIEEGPPPAWTISAGLNSYVSHPAADAFASTRLFADPWHRANEGDQSKALITATALLDRMRWQGRSVAPTQALAWPRVPDRCPHGYPLTVATPPAIEAAAVELAIHLLAQGQLPGAPVMQRMLGDSMTMYFPTITDELPKHVRRLIEPHLRASSANVAEVQL